MRSMQRQAASRDFNMSKHLREPSRVSVFMHGFAQAQAKAAVHWVQVRSAALDLSELASWLATVLLPGCHKSSLSDLCHFYAGACHAKDWVGD